ncbi:MAG: DUF3137 domain-containing protein [Clostridiales bacterium]|nr:DUF3137 domain-containing protein [Clostridiales bacterium]
MKKRDILKWQTLEEGVSRERKKIIIGYAVIGLGLIICVFGFFMRTASSSAVFDIFNYSGLLSAFLGIAYVKYVQKKIKLAVSENIMPEILNSFFDKWEYHPDKRLPDSIVKNVDLEIPSYSDVTGSDYIRAVDKGINIEMSYIEFTYERTKTSVNSRRETITEVYDISVFKGQWIVCDFKKELSADLLLREKRPGENTLGKIFKGKEAVQTENEAFNKKFVIRTPDPHTAFYVLTPHMMEYIMAADKKAGGELHMRFCGSRVHIAVNSGRDAFELTNRETKNLDKVRADFAADLRYITDIIDELRLAGNIYKKQ